MCINLLNYEKDRSGQSDKKSIKEYFCYFQVPFVYFCFYFHYSKRWIQKDMATIYVKECSKFSSKSFIVFSLTFKSLIHFEFIFVYGVTECSNFILLHVAVQFPQHHLLKRLSFLLYIYSCLLCHRLIDHRCVGLFLGSLLCSIVLYFCFCASTILFR